MTLKSDAQFEEKLTLAFKNDMSDLVDFDVSKAKSENMHFNGLILSKIFQRFDLLSKLYGITCVMCLDTIELCKF